MLVNQKKHDVVGDYRWVEYNIFQLGMLFLQQSTYAVGNEISLRKDSTFRYKTCGNIITGTWKVEEDSLLLFWKTNKWRNDSLQLHGYEGKWPELPMKPEKYYIGKDELIRKRKFQDDLGWYKQTTATLRKIQSKEAVNK